MIDGLDPVIHVPKRLAAMAVLANAPTVSFRFLKDQLRLSDSDLSQQMATPEGAGYVTVAKDGRGRGGSTTFRITRAGRQAYEKHCGALRELIGPAGS